MSDLKIQGTVELDVSKADQGFGRIEQSAGKMARAVAQAGDAAGAKVAGIGDGGESAAKKVDQTTSRMVASIQRAIAAEAALAEGGKNSGKFYEIRAQQVGANVEVLKPLIAQYDALREKNAQATAALLNGNGAFEKVEMSAKATAYAMRQVPAQFSDIVVSLQSGQAPFTVFLQQGAQLRDTFGGIAPAAKALAGYMLSLINPVTLAAAAIGAVAYVAYTGKQEFDALGAAVKSTGAYIGLSAQQINDMGAKIALTGAGIADAKEALAQLLVTGKVGADQLQSFGRAALEMAHDTGVGIDKAAQSLAGLSDDAVKWAEKYNEQFHFMSAAQLDLARQYADTGDKAAAAKVVVDSLHDAHTRMYEKAAGELTFLQQYYKDWLVGVGKISVAIKGLFTPPTNSERITELFKEREELENKKRAAERFHEQWRVAQVQKELDDNQRQINAIRDRESAERKLTAEQKARAEAAARNTAVNKYLDNNQYADKGTRYALQVKQENKDFEEAVKGFDKNSKEYEAALKRHNANLKQIAEQNKEKAAPVSDEIAGIKAKTLAAREYIKQLEQYGLAANDLTEGEKAALKIQEQLKGALDGKTRAQLQAALAARQEEGAVERQARALEESLKLQAQFGKQRDKDYADTEARIGQINGEAQALEDQISTYGMSEAALQALTIARLEERKAAIGQFEGSEMVVDQLNREIDAIRRRAAAKDGLGDKDAAAKAAKDATQAWERAASQIEQSLTDALLRGFESGKDFARNLRDTLVNMFKTLVLRPIIQGVVAPVSASLTAAFAPSAANAATTIPGPAGDAVAAAQSASNVYAAISTGFSSVSTGVAKAVQSGIDAAVGGGLSGGAPGTLASGIGNVAGMAAGTAAGLALKKAIGNGYEVGKGFGTFQDIGVAAASYINPALGAAVGAIAGLVNRTFGMKEKELVSSGIKATIDLSNISGISYQNFFQRGGLLRSDKSTVDASALDANTTKLFQEGLSALSKSTLDLAASLGVGGSALDAFKKQIDINFGKDGDPQKAIADFFTSLGDELATTLIPSIADFSKANESASATLQRLGADFKATTQVAQLLGKSAEAMFGSAGIASAAARERLIELSGGVDALGQKAGFYAQNFLTEAERIAPVITAVDAALGSLGLTGVKTVDQYKAAVNALVESGAVATEAGAKQFASLMDLAPAFKQVADYMGLTGQAAKSAADVLAERKGLEEELNQLQSTSAQLLEQQRAKLDESNRALFDQVQAIKAVKEQAEAYTATMQRRRELEIHLMELNGDQAGALSARRQVELSAMDATLIPLQQLIYARQDEKAAMDALISAADSALAGLSRAVDAEKSSLQASYDAQVTLIQARQEVERQAAQASLQAASAQVSAIRSVYDRLKSSASALRDLSRSQAQEVLQSALSFSKQGGSLVGFDGLDEALQAVAKPSEKLFSTFAEYKLDQAKTANTIKALADNAGAQVSVADLTLDAIKKSIDAMDEAAKRELKVLADQHADDLKRLDAIVQDGQKQIDALKGIDTSVMTVADAIAKLQGVLGGSRVSTPSASGASVPNIGGAESVASGGVAIGAGDSAMVAAAKALYLSATTGIASDLFNQYVGAVGGVGGIAGWNGDPEALRKKYSFDVGTNYVPFDTDARVHQGERIIPAADNRRLMAKLDADRDGDLAREVRALREEVAGLRAEARATAGHTARTAKLLDRAMPTGDAFATREVVA